MKLKVCLVGEGGVGKTSLIRRFVLNEFDGRYLQTIGTKVSKKEIVVPLPENGHKMRVDMTIWDIMGQKGFRDLLRESYFYGAQGILAVCDLTRTRTLSDLREWIEGVFEVTGKIPVRILANKADLMEDARVQESDLKEAATSYDTSYHVTSARTGAHVEKAFHDLAGQVASLHIDE